MEAIHIMSGKDKKLSRNSIPSLLEDALAVGFDNSIGHDYFEDASERFDFYTTVETKVPFDIDILNHITKGGYTYKTLNCVVANTGVGKTIFGVHYAASCLAKGYNVLYITLEMSEERISERIDANLLNIDLDDIAFLEKDNFLSKIDKISQKTNGKLIVKEYPPGDAHVGHFKTLLNELKIKKSFVPQVIVIDYLNICASAKYSGSDSYGRIKAVSEELRGLAVTTNSIILTFTQFNRTGMQSSDNDLGDISESIGAAFTFDSFFAMSEPAELAKMNQIAWKQLKNRYSDKNKNSRFIVGLDKSKMKFYNIEDHGQTLVDIPNTSKKATTNFKF